MIPKFLTKTLLLLSLLLPFQAHAEVVDRVVAVVNEDVITLSELNEEGKSYFQAIIKNVPSQQVESEMQRARQEVIKHLIEQLLITQRAKKFDIVISDEEVNQTIDSILERNNITIEQFHQELHAKGTNEKKYRKTLEQQLLKSRLLNLEVRSRIVITDEKIKEYYDSNYISKQKEPGFHILQIGMTWGEGSKTKSREDAYKKAEYVRKLLVDGKNFAELAQTFSDLPSGADGGDIGIFKKEEMAPYMKEAVLPLHPGEFSQIIETPSGLQILKLLSSFEAGEANSVPLEEVKDEISKILYKQEADRNYDKFLAELEAQAFIKQNL